MGSVYKVIDVVGTSEKSWEDAAQTAINVAGESLENLRIAEVTRMDIKIDAGKPIAFRTRLNLSFKYDKE
ncbi:MAG: dodecin domain-containing protein [Desulfovibrio sp.]|nr:MAG: dodecin domain-containing protein [Desulfovibrio sp.]